MLTATDEMFKLQDLRALAEADETSPGGKEVLTVLTLESLVNVVANQLASSLSVSQVDHMVAVYLKTAPPAARPTRKAHSD
ncbi:MAG: hypothetical protein MHM6MM_003166 [Cercozoa sp. M6MM]